MQDITMQELELELATALPARELMGGKCGGRKDGGKCDGGDSYYYQSNHNEGGAQLIGGVWISADVL